MRTILNHQLNKMPPACIHAMANRVQGCVFGAHCKYCDKIFPNKQNLYKHQRHSCPNLITQPYPKFVCFGCHKQVSQTTFYRSGKIPRATSNFGNFFSQPSKQPSNYRNNYRPCQPAIQAEKSFGATFDDFFFLSRERTHQRVIEPSDHISHRTIGPHQPSSHQAVEPSAHRAIEI